MVPKITPVFSEQCEIRMGSPFNHAHLMLQGTWVPELPGDGWQDVFAHNDDGTLLSCLAQRMQE